MDVEKRLTPLELAQRWGVHRDTVYAMVRKKQIPHFRIGEKILFRLASIEQWEHEQERKGMEVG